MLNYTEEKQFKAMDFTTTPLKKGEYERCDFAECRFGGLDLSGYIFIDCQFKNCDLSNVGLKNTALRNVFFEQCKLIGLHFEDCAPGLFAVNFDACQLQFSSFYGLKMKATSFKSCRLNESNFTDCDLRKAIFQEAELQLTRFDHCQLEEADFTAATCLELDPELNKIKGAHFEWRQLPQLLAKYQLNIS